MSNIRWSRLVIKSLSQYRNQNRGRRTYPHVREHQFDDFYAAYPARFVLGGGPLLLAACQTTESTAPAQSLLNDVKQLEKLPNDRTEEEFAEKVRKLGLTQVSAGELEGMLEDMTVVSFLRERYVFLANGMFLYLSNPWDSSFSYSVPWGHGYIRNGGFWKVANDRIELTFVDPRFHKFSIEQRYPGAIGVGNEIDVKGHIRLWRRDASLVATGGITIRTQGNKIYTDTTGTVHLLRKGLFRYTTNARDNLGIGEVSGAIEWATAPEQASGLRWWQKGPGASGIMTLRLEKSGAHCYAEFQHEEGEGLRVFGIACNNGRVANGSFEIDGDEIVIDVPDMDGGRLNARIEALNPKVLVAEPTG